MSLIWEPDRIDKAGKHDPEEVAENGAIPERDRPPIETDTAQLEDGGLGSPYKKDRENVATLGKCNCDRVDRPPCETGSKQRKKGSFTGAEQPDKQFLMIEKVDFCTFDPRY